MALTYGFYNSIEGDRVYDAIQFGRIFDGIIKDGVYATYEKGMMVIASSNPAEVIIQPGRAWFNHTWSYNDANVIFEAPAPEVLLERYDALVLEINEELSSRENSYKWVQGTPSSRPERPTLTNTTTIHQYPLCYVHRYPETTMIYTRDITNMIGTSECPFATGVLEGIDLDAWINQWDDEFHTWENSKKTQFEAWMLSQETAFTTWYNAFKDQMASDVQEVEDFVDYLKSVLDASTAIHLQEEIDELKNEISSGSHITVTTINPELYGRNVTITEAGGTVFTEKFDNTGVAVFKSVPYVGNLTISSTYGTQTAERVVNTPYYARYEFAIAFWAATVNIVGDPEMAGYSVTVKDSEEAIVGTVVLDNLGTGVYTAIKPDTYKFTLTYGGETMEVTLSVTQETTYTVDLHAAGFKWQDWLEAGGVTGSYESLDDVLEDEKALRRLFTVHASVDYMADIRDENEDVEKIIETDLAAKWINLRDYALGTLYANEIIAGYMDTADKYFYGEWALMPQVPKMTSNTAPYGEAYANSVYSQGTNIRSAYYAFDGVDDSNAGNDKHSWVSAISSDVYVQYKFINPICITHAEIWPCYNVDFSPTYAFKNYKIQASNDNDTYVDLYTGINSDKAKHISIDLDNSTSYLYYRLFIIDTWGGAYTGTSLQFYAYAPKGNVPVMTSNTAPYGEASASVVPYSSHPAWHAFDGNPSTAYSAGSTANAILSYKFTNPVCVKRVMFDTDKSANYSASIKTWDIIAKNDTSANWETIYSGSNNDIKIVEQEISCDQYYLYWGIKIKTSYRSESYALDTLQFYGRELSVSVPKMATNTTPFGEASASGNGTDGRSAIYKVFDGVYSNAENYWYDNSYHPWIQYDFGRKVAIKTVVHNGNPDATRYNDKTITILGSNDNFVSDSHELGTFEVTRTNYAIDFFNIVNANAYRYIRMRVDEAYKNGVLTDSYGGCTELQFYGLDYSEREFEEGVTKKWLYDHGVELETFTLAKSNNNCVAEKRNSSIYLSKPSNGVEATASVTLDLTPYDLMRGKIGSIFYTDNGNAYMGVINGNTGIAELTLKNNTSLMPNNLGIDISSIDGSYKAAFTTAGGGNATQFDFVEFWLE